MLSVGYPEPEAEARMLDVHLTEEPVLAGLAPVISREDLLGWQKAASRVFVSEEMRRYLVDVARALRTDERNLGAVSPRATLHLARAAQAHALLDARDFLGVADVKAVAPHVMAHRVRGVEASTTGEVVASVLSRVPAPW